MMISMRLRAIGGAALAISVVISECASGEVITQMTVCDAAKKKIDQGPMSISVLGQLEASGIEFQIFLLDKSCPKQAIQVILPPNWSNQGILSDLSRALYSKPTGTFSKDITGRFVGILERRPGKFFPILKLESVDHIRVTLRE